MSAPGDAPKSEEEARRAKLELEIEKLTLDKRLVQRQFTWHGIALEWLKAGSVFVALVGVAVTLFIGQGQLRNAQDAANKQAQQAQENRTADRFEKALTHLAKTESVGERLTGVEGLRLLLRDDSESHQIEALEHLINAIAHEPSYEVRQAILDAFSDLRGVSRSALDKGLGKAVEVDRHITKVYVHDKLASFDKDMHEMLARVRDADVKAQFELSRVRSKLQFFHPPGLPDDHEVLEVVVLDDLVAVINALIKSGAHNPTKDWKEIYCQECDFRPTLDLDDSYFDGAFLSGANFAHVKLRRGKFRNADLRRAVFFDSDLSDADLSWQIGLGPSMMFFGWFNESADSWFSRPYPYLQCAKLNGANLDRLPLGQIYVKFDGPSESSAKPEIQLWLPDVSLTEIDSRTHMDSFGLRRDAFYTAERVASHLKGRNSVSGMMSFFGGDWPEEKVSGRASIIGGIVEQADRKSRALARNDMLWLRDTEAVSGWAREPFATAFAQHFWETLPATAQIFRAAGGQNVRHEPRDKPSYQCSQAAVPPELDDEYSFFPD